MRGDFVEECREREGETDQDSGLKWSCHLSVDISHQVTGMDIRCEWNVTGGIGSSGGTLRGAVSQDLSHCNR